MRKKQARHIIEDWLKILEWPGLPFDNDNFEQDELADTIADALDLSDDDLTDLAKGLNNLMAAYDKIGIYNFNVMI